MSNNDLWCNKCKSQHHPDDCPVEKAAERREVQSATASISEQVAWNCRPVPGWQCIHCGGRNAVHRTMCGYCGKKGKPPLANG